jgi:tRNA(Ile)-lysidine synthase
MNLDDVRVNLVQACRLPAGARIVVGVSGGPDSLCLLDVLVRLGFSVWAAHYNHQLRPEADRDAGVVRAAASTLNVPFLSGSASVAEWAAEHRLSIEEAARGLRYRFLFDCARRQGAQAVAVGHTADDQVETVLMHLLRGAGLAGLKGMVARTIMPEWDPSIALVRPLLATWREDTLAYCQERGLPYVIDASNQDTTFYRNRLRHELIPILQTYNPQIKPVMWRMARLLAGDEQIVQNAVQQAWDTCLERLRPTFVALRLADLRAQPVAVQRLLLRKAISQLRPALRNVDSEAVERGVDFIRTPARSGRSDLLQGLWLVYEPQAAGDGLLLVGEESLLAAAGSDEDHWPQLEGDSVLFEPPTRIAVGAGWDLEARWVDLAPEVDVNPSAAGRWEAYLNSDACSLPLTIRRQQSGDRFQPLGMEGHSQKLSDFWINEKLPRRARANWPLICCDNQIAWIPGFRPAHPFRIQSGAARALYLRLHCVAIKK